VKRRKKNEQFKNIKGIVNAALSLCNFFI